MKVLSKLVWVGLLVAAAGGIIIIGILIFFLKDLPSVSEISERPAVQSTKIYERTGKTILYEVSGGEKRTVVPLSEIPETLKDATILIEDEGFYESPGFDWRAIVRSVWVNVTHGRIVQGGSTITQQLARNAFLSPEQTFSRKIKELILALQLTSRYSKDQVLEFYLNEIPYGPTAYGVEAASRAYFNKSVKEINLAESALLAALPRGPSYYSPWGNHVDELMARQQHILEKMRDRGKIDEEQYEAALATKITFAPQREGGKATHFVIAVQDYLVQRYGEDVVRTGGLRVTTTLDEKLQEVAERVVAEGAEQNEKLYDGKNAALVAEDARTGQILALVGSRDYFDVENDGNFNVATQGMRQPGSALKPFVYLNAFEHGYTPDTVLFDVPTEFTTGNANCPAIVNFSNSNKDCYHPQNFDGKFRGPMPLRHALAQSVNIPAVKTLYLVGLDGALETASRLGISTLQDPRRYGLSLVLGGGEVKLIELVGAYAVLAQDGIRRPQTMILEVKDAQGNVLESYKEEGEQVIDPQPVRLVNDVLSDIDARAGLFHGSLGLTTFPNHEVALKTGTSNDYRDAWAVGYIPSLVVGVWAGNNDNAPMHRQGSSILAAIPIWSKFMNEALKEYPTEPFPRPEPVNPSKPVLRGDYLSQGIHSILYFVNKRDPQGPPPANPYADPQFTNWETAIVEWARANGVGSGSPFFPRETATGAPRIFIEEPQNGAFVRGDVKVRALVQAASPVSKVKLSFNNKVVQEFNGPFQTSFELNWTFSPGKFELQNLLSIEAIDQNNKSGKAETIVYR